MDFLCVLVLLPLSVGAVDPELIITAERGQNVSLTCRAPPLLEAGFWSGGGGRVFLEDGGTEDGDPSVVLERVDTADSGTYWCRVLRGGGGARPDSGPVGAVRLVVVPELELIQAQSGQSVTLPCRGAHVDPQVNIVWSRHDPDPREVLLIQDGVVLGQHPSFRNRVEVGRGAERGDLSVTLKSVTPEDSGTYECRAVRRSAPRSRRSGLQAGPISSVHLSVSPAAAGSAHNGGAEDAVPPALMAGAFAAGVALGAAAAVLAVVLRRRSERQNRDEVLIQKLQPERAAA
ncbi:hypothetical protein OJAV_G00185830 [Oryzias javanicus]|uniref:Ig-like domain-containing protein n=1 Tax=Oryzias javanicus TaxID=123683 RepID=A0A3S2PH51_ORYJA|nr:hypothetical protein OJAV_G00185830 [Oryzias javanicus]